MPWQALWLWDCSDAAARAVLLPAPTAARRERPNSDIKVGVILLGDDAESYTAAHIQGIEEAVSNLGLSEDKNIIWKYNVPEEQECYEAAVDLVASGCDLVISNSYGIRPLWCRLPQSIRMCSSYL